MTRPSVRDRLAFELATRSTATYAALIKASDIAGDAYRTAEHYLSEHALDDLDRLSETVTEIVTGEPICARCLTVMIRRDGELYSLYIAAQAAGKVDDGARDLSRWYDNTVPDEAFSVVLARALFALQGGTYRVWEFLNDTWIARANHWRLGGHDDWTRETTKQRWIAEQGGAVA